MKGVRGEEASASLRDPFDVERPIGLTGRDLNVARSGANIVPRPDPLILAHPAAPCRIRN
jgi:hypothetical protein